MDVGLLDALRKTVSSSSGVLEASINQALDTCGGHLWYIHRFSLYFLMHDDVLVITGWHGVGSDQFPMQTFESNQQNRLGKLYYHLHLPLSYLLLRFPTIYCFHLVLGCHWLALPTSYLVSVTTLLLDGCYYTHHFLLLILLFLRTDDWLSQTQSRRACYIIADIADLTRI